MGETNKWCNSDLIILVVVDDGRNLADLLSLLTWPVHYPRDALLSAIRRVVEESVYKAYLKV